MILDCHIHITDQLDPPEVFQSKLQQAGVGGGIVFSYHPAGFDNATPSKGDAGRRIEQVMEFTRSLPEVSPFFFIDPTEPDAADQVDEAVAAGIAGFKVICTHHLPADPRALPVYQRIARAGRPMLFHSGILYNDGPSAEFNRPGNFEPLFYVEGLRFAMAHISWPWCDELIAVFGKWNYLANEKPGGINSELFVDLTPGTPGIYRKEALGKLLTVAYPSLPDHMLFGTDCSSVYNVDNATLFIERDQAIYDELGVSQQVRQGIFGGNLQAFLGKSGG